MELEYERQMWEERNFHTETGMVLAKVETKSKVCTATNTRIVRFLGEVDANRDGEFEWEDIYPKYPNEFEVISASTDYYLSDEDREYITNIVEIFEVGDFM